MKKINMNDSTIINTKPPRIKVGTDDFKNLLLNSDIFVDKSLLIKELLEESGEVVLITRPRRWGKSLNMNMIKTFFEIEVDDQDNKLSEEKRTNRKLFLGGVIDLNLPSGRTKTLNPLKISQYSDIIIDYQGNYPVMLINFKSVRGNSYDEILAGIKSVLRNTFQQHEYLSRSKRLTPSEKNRFVKYIDNCENLTNEEVKTGLYFLSEILYKHFKRKVFILIDEYDAPIHSSYLKHGHESEDLERILELFRAMMGSSLKSNPYLERGIITGILRIAKANLFSDLNNVSEYCLLDKKFSKHYGFTQEEVDELLKKVPVSTSPKKIKDWYNGYTFGGIVTYNPWSIMQCLANQGSLDTYWIDSGGTGLIDKFLLSDEIQEDLQHLADGRHIISPIIKQISFLELDQPTAWYSLLLFSGYLNPIATDSIKNIYELSVPNEEVSYIYKARMLYWVANQLKIDNSRYYSLINLLPSEKIDEFKEKLQKLLLNSTSFYQTGEVKAELFYSGFMLGLIHTLTTDYFIDSERETGSGRADIILMPKNDRRSSAIIIEYKITKIGDDLSSVAKKGLTQINEKCYDVKIKENHNVKKIIKISLAFRGKEIALEYQIDDSVVLK